MLHICQDHENESDDEGHEMEITGNDVNHEDEDEDDKAGFKSNDESMNDAEIIKGKPEQQHEDELDVSNDTTVTKLLMMGTDVGSDIPVGTEKEIVTL